MNDLEFNIIDELYFVSDFDEIRLNTQIESSKLKKVLLVLLKKKWITLYDKKRDEEIAYVNEKFEQNFKSYYYLATKKGLLKHNSN